MKVHYQLCIVFLLVGMTNSCLIAQEDEDFFIKSLNITDEGADYHNSAYCVEQMPSGNFVIAGDLDGYMFCAIITPEGELEDYETFVLRATNCGNPPLTKTLLLKVSDMIVASTGEIVVIGTGENSCNGGKGLFVVKINSSLQMSYYKVFDKSDTEVRGFSIVEDVAGHFVATGSITQISGQQAITRLLLVKLNSVLQLAWATSFQLDNYNKFRGYAIKQNAYAEYAISGVISQGGTYSFLVLTDSTGNPNASYIYLGMPNNAHDMLTESGPNYILSGGITNGSNMEDVMFMKVGSAGSINTNYTKWTDGQRSEISNAILEISDEGDYLVAGSSNSFTGDGMLNALFMRLGSNGSFEYAHNYGFKCSQWVNESKPFCMRSRFSDIAYGSDSGSYLASGDIVDGSPSDWNSLLVKPLHYIQGQHLIDTSLYNCMHQEVTLISYNNGFPTKQDLSLNIHDPELLRPEITPGTEIFFYNLLEFCKEGKESCSCNSILKRYKTASW